MVKWLCKFLETGFVSNGEEGIVVKEYSIV